MSDILKKGNLNLNYSYLLIAKKTILDDQYDQIKENLLLDFKKMK